MNDSNGEPRGRGVSRRGFLSGTGAAAATITASAWNHSRGAIHLIFSTHTAVCVWNATPQWVVPKWGRTVDVAARIGRI